MKFVADRLEFAAQRRGAQVRGDEDLHPVIMQALAQWGQDRWWAPILTAAGALFDQTAETEGADPDSVAAPRDEFLSALSERLAETTEPGSDHAEQAERITKWVTTFSLNAATFAAAGAEDGDVTIEWLSMHDPLVRSIHQDVDGQTVPVGATFSVGGYELHYPGEPVGPPSVWINCRCVVRPGPGGDMTASLVNPTVLVAAATDTVDTEVDPNAPAITEDDLDLDVPFYGVAAPEGLPTGDKRKFNVGALRFRDLPLPFKYQPTDQMGHDGSIVVGRIDNIWRDEATNTMRYQGVFARTPEAEAYISLVADRMMRGVSVDLDDVTVELQNEDGSPFEYPEEFNPNDPQPFSVVTDGRIASITGCAIPAFQEAYIALGTWADDPGENPVPTEAPVPTDEAAACDTCEVAAALEAMKPEHRAAFEATFGDQGDGTEGFTFVAEDGTAYEFDEVGLHIFTPDDTHTYAPGTHDGPGWITNPRATARIRRYWVRGEGALKIRWGQPGDFNRCRRQLAKYVKNPDWLAGLCANMHKEAIGLWPGQEGGKKHSIEPGAVTASAFTLVASFAKVYPSEWFKDPGFSEPTPIRVDSEGRIYGHVAQWGVCHIGITGVCTEPPHSESGYAHYALHEVETDEGFVPVGTITMGTGHAGHKARLAPAAAHYDNTGTMAAKVAIGEDAHGIWISGVTSPGLTEAEQFALSGATLSGDWREDGHGNLELVAALAVNVPGFPIERTALAASGQRQTSLVAAGLVLRTEQDDLAEKVAASVLATLDRRERRRVAQARLRAAQREAVFAALNQ